jgi:hypothetical protein
MAFQCRTLDEFEKKIGSERPHPDLQKSSTSKEEGEQERELARLKEELAESEHKCEELLVVIGKVMEGDDEDDEEEEEEDDEEEEEEEEEDA